MKSERTVYQRLKGPVVPINVCFTDDDKVHYSAMRKYVSWLCEQKVPVLLLTYGSSEFASLTDEEIWKLTAELAEAVAGRSLFIASTGWWRIEQCRQFLKHAEKAGVDAVKVQINPWQLGSVQPQREFFLSYHQQLLDSSKMPLVLWCNSGGAAPISVDVIAELARHPRVVGVKNDNDPFYYYYDLIRATAGQQFAVISGGQMKNFAFGYQVGATAYLCTIAPFRPDIALKFYGCLVAGRYDDAWQMVKRYEDPWLKAASGLDWLRSIKSAINLHGLYPNNRVRPPNTSHTAADRDKIRQCLKSVFGSIKKSVLK